MTASRRSFFALTGGWLLAAAWPRVPAVAAKKAAGLALPAGARVGVVNLLDAEVTHFHASPRLQDSYLKTYTLKWQVARMLTDAVREPLTQMNLLPVPVAAGEALSRAREECFLNANLEKALSKECAAPYVGLALASQLAALIVLGPGLNNSTHAQATRRKDLPEYLRGWCVVTDAAVPASLPTLLNLSELLLIGITPNGALLADRAWGGALTQTWTGFSAPPDLRALPERQLDELQPLYAALLKQQANALLGHLEVTR